MARWLQIGAIEPFDGDDFADYSKQLETNNIFQDESHMTLLNKQLTKRKLGSNNLSSLLSVRKRKSLKDVCLHDRHFEKTYEQVTDILRTSYKPSLNVSACSG